jgi:hypothetical protein
MVERSTSSPTVHTAVGMRTPIPVGLTTTARLGGVRPPPEGYAGAGGRPIHQGNALGECMAVIRPDVRRSVRVHARGAVRRCRRRGGGRPPKWCSQRWRRAAYEERRAAAAGVLAIEFVRPAAKSREQDLGWASRKWWFPDGVQTGGAGDDPVGSTGRIAGVGHRGCRQVRRRPGPAGRLEVPLPAL